MVKINKNYTVTVGDYNINLSPDALFQIKLMKISPDELFEISKVESLNKYSGIEFSKKWLDLWPTQAKTGLNYSVSGNTKVCKAKIKTFVKSFFSYFPNLKTTYTVSNIEELIYRATKEYLTYQESRMYLYTKKNSKFIQDSAGSVLEEWCNKLIKNELIPLSVDILDNQAK